MDHLRAEKICKRDSRGLVEYRRGYTQCTLQTPPRRPARQKTEPHIERFFAPYSWRTQRSAHYATAQSRPRSGGRPRCPRYIPNCQACAVVEFADSMRDWRSLSMLGEACRSCKPTSTTSTSSTIELYRYTRFHVRRSTTGRHNGGGALLASSGRTVVVVRSGKETKHHRQRESCARWADQTLRLIQPNVFLTITGLTSAQLRLK